MYWCVKRAQLQHCCRLQGKKSPSVKKSRVSSTEQQNIIQNNGKISNPKFGAG